MDIESFVVVMLSLALIVESIAVLGIGWTLRSITLGVMARQEKSLSEAHNRVMLFAHDQMDRAMLETQQAKDAAEAARGVKHVVPTPPGYAHEPAARSYNAGEYGDINIVDRSGGPD